MIYISRILIKNLVINNLLISILICQNLFFDYYLFTRNFIFKLRLKRKFEYMKCETRMKQNFSALLTILVKISCFRSRQFGMDLSSGFMKRDSDSVLNLRSNI
ncbi:hypothetical protein BpHYR1_007459 [Brachionus plicatilis]|uniref:Uncharacterized protein n=1 Tax=Brachionus plicatilis TaxID=10195 RepID=A0A3M7Q546_BRAPC|nr:hypothetical protein BpHYR1_007459 [Brachionus plicatilis]